MQHTQKDHLKRQLGFIQKSCGAYDAGDDAEALRIATALRVLVHQTANSDSLFSQMGIRNTIKLLSTIRPVPATSGVTDGISILSPKGSRLVHPPLGSSRHYELVAVEDWWTQSVFSRDNQIVTRKDMVLLGANKDGGAHVDWKINNKGKMLREGGFWTAGIVKGKSVDTGDFHLVGLRQFGYELLNSPDLAQFIHA